MKTFTTAATLFSALAIENGAAFTLLSSISLSAPLHMSEQSLAENPTETVDVNEDVAAQAETVARELTSLPKMSESMPFMERPAVLTGALAGNVGFDPFGFAKIEADLMNYREAEIKHARLAMLATAGWPIYPRFWTRSSPEHLALLLYWMLPIGCNPFSMEDSAKSLPSIGLGVWVLLPLLISTECSGICI